MYKIQNGKPPSYLADECPALVNVASRYLLRNSLNISVPRQRTSSYQRSFFPRTIKDYNALPNSTRQAPSMNSFKTKLNDGMHIANPLFAYGHGRASINHTRIRLGLSALCWQRMQYGLIPNGNCPLCGNAREDSDHYFLRCQAYSVHRIKMMRELARLLAPGVHYTAIVPSNKTESKYFLDLLLSGSKDISYSENTKIFNVVRQYITDTNRFM